MDDKDQLHKLLNTMISKAINDCFTDSLVYGTGYIRVTYKEGELSVENVPFKDIEKELQSVVEISKLTKLM